jgi:hypothetical protein
MRDRTLSGVLVRALRRAVMVGLVLVAACDGDASRRERSPGSGPTGAAATAPAPSEREIIAHQESVLALVEEMGAVADRAGHDCGKAAAEIPKVMERVRALSADPRFDTEAMRALGTLFLRGHADRVNDAGTKFKALAVECADDERFMKAVAAHRAQLDR